jgi:uncharacterized YigZ family protein
VSSRCDSPPAYRAPRAPARAELRERGSRFLALLEPVTDEGAARERLARIAREHARATHVCYAWRIGAPARERSADAGEPAGTAGAPILRVLRGAKLSDTLVVVARWFGGVKLGKGGLARAYAGSARAAVEAAIFETRVPATRIRVIVPFAAQLEAHLARLAQLRESLAALGLEVVEVVARAREAEDAGS